MKQELQQIAQKIGELEQEKEEHQMVIETLKPLKEDRTCYRLVGGILVQKNVKETLPSVEANQQGIVSLMTTLGNSYKQKEDQLVEYQKKFNIKINQ
jgi:prefoldin subunit 2